MPVESPLWNRHNNDNIKPGMCVVLCSGLIIWSVYSEDYTVKKKSVEFFLMSAVSHVFKNGIIVLCAANLRNSTRREVSERTLQGTTMAVEAETCPDGDEIRIV